MRINTAHIILALLLLLTSGCLLDNERGRTEHEGYVTESDLFVLNKHTGEVRKLSDNRMIKIPYEIEQLKPGIIYKDENGKMQIYHGGLRFSEVSRIDEKSNQPVIKVNF